MSRIRTTLTLVPVFSFLAAGLVSTPALANAEVCDDAAALAVVAAEDVLASGGHSGPVVHAKTQIHSALIAAGGALAEEDTQSAAQHLANAHQLVNQLVPQQRPITHDDLAALRDMTARCTMERRTGSDAWMELEAVTGSEQDSMTELLLALDSTLAVDDDLLADALDSLDSLSDELEGSLIDLTDEGISDTEALLALQVQMAEWTVAVTVTSSILSALTEMLESVAQNM